MDRATGALERVGIVRGEIWRDLLPAGAFSPRTPHVLRRDVERGRIVGRDQHRESPLETLGHIGRTPAVVVAHGHRDVALLSATVIVARERAHVAAAVGDQRIARINGDRCVLAAGHAVVVAFTDLAIVGPARDGNGGVVLLRAVNAVRELVVGSDVIELRGGLIVDAGPGGASIETDCAAAIIRIDDPPGVLRIDPERMRVAVRHVDLSERLATIDRAIDGEVHDVHRVFVLRIGGHERVVPRAHPEARIGGGAFPRVAGVVRTENASAGIFGFDTGEDAARIGG